MIGLFGILMGAALAIHRRDVLIRNTKDTFATALATFPYRVTEPIEYMFMFVAMPLYSVYAVVQGAAFK